jgi:microsomal dipeptidase-like Zn-dependent dipeptidase
VGRPAWRAIQKQWGRIRDEAQAARVEVATSAAGVWESFESGRGSVILGLEGGDGMGLKLSRLDELSGWGVRLLLPVHFRDNNIGTTRLPRQRYMGMPGTRPLPLTRSFRVRPRPSRK